MKSIKGRVVGLPDASFTPFYPFYGFMFFMIREEGLP